MSAEDTTRLQRVLQSDVDFIYSSGFTKPISKITIDDRDQLIRTMWLHYTIYHPHAELEQLRIGLCDTLDVGTLVVTHPRCMWSLLASKGLHLAVTCDDYLIDSFVINFSCQGSNSRILEESIIFKWFEYITECEGKFTKEFHTNYYLGKNRDVSLPTILQFLSGSSQIPVTGFNFDPKIYFSTEENKLPWVSTCDVSITFPTSLSGLSLDEFTAKMDLCMLGSAGFGTV